MGYIAVKTNNKQNSKKDTSVLITVKHFNTEEDKEKILKKYSSYLTKEFGENDYNEILLWTNFKIDNYVSKLIEDNNLKEIFIETIETAIRNTLIKLTISYMLNNPKIKLIYSDDEHYEEAKTSEHIYKKFDTAILLNRGKYNPIDYDTISTFWALPSVNGKEDIINYIKNGKDLYVPQYIKDVVYSQLTYDKDKLAQMCVDNLNIINIKNSVDNIPDAVIKGADYKVFIKENIKKNIDDIVIDIINGNLGTFGSEDFYTLYLEGCKLLNIPVEYQLEYYETANEFLEEKAYQLVKNCDLVRFIVIPNEKGFNPTEKSISSKQRKFKKLVEEIEKEKVIKADRLRDKFLIKCRNVITEIIRYTLYCEKNNIEFYVDYLPIIKKICMIEINEYLDNELPIELGDVLLPDKCKFDFIFYGIVYTTKYTFINEETKLEILKKIPASPELEYPAAREMTRHFIIEYGPTNSGKTYNAIEALKKATSGAYLGPLRLLALEIQDKLNSNNVPCSLLTGEEEEIIPEAQHVSSTVEKADILTKYDTVVIDECQMIKDPERGFAWTRAILGIQAEKIYLCLGPEAVDLMIKLINLCGDTYELVEHKRRSELVTESPLDKFELDAAHIQEGDALIVFSKKKVLNVAANLISMGIKTSLIYGNLPYSVRKKQVDRFLKHETDVIVSTDAIGMGINLPVRRIIFLENEKFNGKKVVPLDVSTVKQIAGRAGRNQETGYVNTNNDILEIKNLLNSKTPEVKKAYLGFSDEIISIDAELSDILKVWKSIETTDIFTRMDIDRYLNLDQMIYVNVTKHEKLKMINIPFDEGNEYILNLWKNYCFAYEKKEPIYIPLCEGTELNNLEDYYKGLDLYYSFSRNFGYDIDIDWLNKEKEKVSDRINTALIKDIEKHQRTCIRCGRPLKWDFPFKICDRCFSGVDDKWYMQDNNTYNQYKSKKKNNFYKKNNGHSRNKSQKNNTYKRHH